MCKELFVLGLKPSACRNATFVLAGKNMKAPNKACFFRFLSNRQAIVTDLQTVTNNEVWGLFFLAMDKR